MSDTMRRVSLTPLVAPPAERAVRPSPSVAASHTTTKELPVTEDRVLDLPSDEESARLIAAEIAAGAAGRQSVPAEVVEALHQETARQAARTATNPARRRSQMAASETQQAVLTGVPQISGGYTKTRLGTVVLVGNVGASKNILAKRVAGRDLVEFSFAARTLGHTEPTWYRCTLWQGAEADLDLIRQGMYLQLKGQALQSQSHATGRIFLDVTVQRVAEGPVKGQQLSVAASVPQQRGYFARLWDALRGR